jgi:hypothetical protein
MASKQVNHRINLFLSVALGLLNGCGDFSTNGDGSMTQMMADAIVSRLGGTDFKLSEITASAGGEEMGIEVHVEGTSLLLDFSNVNNSGVFDAVAFAGYVLRVNDEAHRTIVDVVLDESLSTVDSYNIELRFNDRQLAVDLRGLAYDASTFVKIDIFLDDAG